MKIMFDDDNEFIYYYFFKKMKQESCQEFEQRVIAQFEAIIHCINGRRDYLLSAIRMDRDNKIRILKVNGDMQADVLYSRFENSE